MKNKDEIISKYSKKIYGFAYSKTHNYHDAEDLASEIIVQLLGGKIDFDKIDNKNAYIYRICCYTWSNFLRKNKPHWECIGSEELPEVAEEAENEYADEELYLRLRSEVMYLGKLRREIMIKYYYENLKIKEIAEILCLPESTVKWHMSETKSVLKERIEMTNEAGIYQPIRLEIGHNGWVKEYSMCGLVSDKIMQNICYICSKEAHTVEEIARTMGVAAVYLEDKIEKLLYMDYLKELRGGKYITAFYVRDKEYLLEYAYFFLENVSKIALPVFKISQEILPKLKAANAVAGEFSDDFLLYSIAMLISDMVNSILYKEVNKKIACTCSKPKRKDGSEHWVNANVAPIMDSVLSGKDKEVWSDYSKTWGSGPKFRWTANIKTMQIDIGTFGGWRDFEGTDIRDLERAIAIIENNEEPNEYDKEIMASLCKKGYIRLQDGKPVLLVPYLTDASVIDAYGNITLEDIDKKYNTEILSLVDSIVAHIVKTKRLLPKHLDSNERNYILSCSFGFSHPQIVYYLYKSGLLYTPSKEEQKRICTLVYKSKRKTNRKTPLVSLF